jgi:hypothetical protein
MELNWYWPANGQLTSITLAVEFALTGTFSSLLFSLLKEITHFNFLNLPFNESFLFFR